MENGLNLPYEQVRMLLVACDGDAALLYLWQKGETAMPCPLSGSRLENAQATLCRLGLDESKKAPPERDVRPTYTEDVVTQNLQKREFSALVGEVQRTLGRILSTEELKCLLGIHEYLRMPGEVVAILISYCVQRNRARGMRAPSLRNVEKEAYRWADAGIDTVEVAVRYVQAQLLRQGRQGRIAAILQITGRRLTSGEENYINQWVDWGFPDDTIRLAYEKTCMGTGGLKWPYLHSILSSWHDKGLRTVEDVKTGDGTGKKPESKKRQVSDFEREAVRKLMGEKEG